MLETISGDGFIRSGYRYELIRDGLKIADVSLRIPGYYNDSDSLAAAAVSSAMGCAVEEISRGLSSFEGAKRRFEIVGKTQSGAVIISDYAHHPSEIKVTVDAARSNTNGKLIAVFQPHTFTRAKRFKRKFAKALKEADTVILTDIYAAREPDTGLITSDDLLRLFLRKGLNAVHISDFGDIAEYVKNCASKDDTVLILGAGSVYKIAELVQ